MSVVGEINSLLVHHSITSLRCGRGEGRGNSAVMKQIFKAFE